MLNDKDTKQIKEHGLNLDQVDNQINNFRNGFDFLAINRAAVVSDGIIAFDDQLLNQSINTYDKTAGNSDIVKFVPASGAATRMFKELFEYVNDNKKGMGIDTLLENINKFAFYNDLCHIVGDENDPKKIVSAIIKQGLDYGSKPKALILFHKYIDISRTAVEEHLSEGALYATSNGKVNIHFTISPEHRSGFDALLSEVVNKYEAMYGVKYNISFSQQKSSTDTIAVTPDNEPFRNDDGTLLFRPAGHGALIENLNEIEADLIYIKTVDNVAPDRLKADTVKYKKAIGGVLIDLQSQIFDILRDFDSKGTDVELISKAESFVQSKLMFKLPAGYNTLNNNQKTDILISILDRPIRVCGMVKNEGEPGGGPFWVNTKDGAQSLQIAESSQISPLQIGLMKVATHFNPVDLVCGVKNFRDKKFDLTQYIDPSTGFISNKSKDGRELRAQELPGLWNGAMANWNTIFVEVPISTFSPVKIVNDLLRDQHQ